MTDPVRYNAYCELLEQPDLSCLPHRGRRASLAGDEAKVQTLRLMTELAALAYRRQAHAGEIVEWTVKR